jgi:hypothetical protein
MNGTSESAALVSGTALLLQQYYKSINGNVLPSALAKAILINSADDINTPGPDYATGFGNMKAAKAMNVIRDNTIFTGTVTQGSIKQFSITVPANIKQLKVSLAWNDTVATAFAPEALINDIDLNVTSALTNQAWQPWVLSTFPDKDSLTALPVRKRDSLNNAEQVTIEDPVAGTYLIDVSGYNILYGEQTFYIVYSYDTTNHFEWNNPTGIDFLEAGKENVLRWESNFPATGDIEYRYSSSNTWLPVIDNIDLSKKFFNWMAPDTIVMAFLRIRSGPDNFYSDSFLITPLLNPKVGFVCSDSVLLYWNKLTAINGYEVYELGEKYMEPFTKVSDTSVLLPVSKLTTKYFAVAPILNNGVAGVESYAFDYTLQGTGCYIKSFITEPDSNVARLMLSLGTLFKVRSVEFERLTPSGFASVYNSTVNNQLEIFYNFPGLTKGINIFRAKIILENGQIIYSANGSVYYIEKGKYLVFPVPVKRGKDIEVFTVTPDGEMLQLFNMMGRIVLNKQINSPHEYINTYSLQPGQYLYRITKIGKKVGTGKLLIL